MICPECKSELQPSAGTCSACGWRAKVPAAVVDADDAELAEQYSEIDAEDQDIAALPADLRFRIVKHDVEIVIRSIKACFVNRTLTNARTAANEFQAKLDSYELPPEAAENLTWLANRKTFLVVLDELAMRESELDQLVFEVKAAYKRHDYKGCCEKALLAKAICTEPRGYEEEYKTSNNRWRQIQDKWGEADAMSRSRRWHEVMVVCDEILELQQFNEDAKKLRQHARGILVNRRKVRRLVIVAVFVAIIGAVAAGAIRWVPAMLDSMRSGKVIDKIDIAYEDARSRSNLGENLTRSDVAERLRETLVLLAKLDEMQLQLEQRAEFEKTSQHVKAYQGMSKQPASIEAFIAQAQQAFTHLPAVEEFSELAESAIIQGANANALIPSLADRPVFITIGNSDPRIGEDRCLDFHARLAAASSHTPPFLFCAPGNSHGDDGRFPADTGYQAAAGWLLQLVAQKVKG
jgi:hypothetical protein